jgi:PAS domain S-box-containing protein
LKVSAGGRENAEALLRDEPSENQSPDSGWQTEDLQRRLLESIQDHAIFMLDREGRVATWNLGAERLNGYRAPEILGKPHAIFFLEQDVQEGVPARLLQTAARDGRAESEGWRVCKDGTRYWTNSVVSAFNDASGKLIGFAMVTRDLTERRANEQERLRLTQTREALRLRDEFLLIASHELRTPLTALQLQLQSLAARRDELDGKLARKVERAVRSGQRLSDLVETLLDVSRISSGRFSLHLERFDLADAIREVAARFEEQAAQACSELTVQVEPNLVGSWDRLRIEQVVTNLVSNALKYATGTRVRVTATRAKGEVVMDVVDGGPGVLTEQLPHIFERFERAASKRHYGGLGLGLYLVRQIVESHGGSVAAHNEPQGGARFTVRLPLPGDGASGGRRSVSPEP